MKEAYKKCMKEKNTIKIKSYESPCGVLLLGFIWRKTLPV